MGVVSIVVLLLLYCSDTGDAVHSRLRRLSANHVVRQTHRCVLCHSWYFFLRAARCKFSLTWRCSHLFSFFCLRWMKYFKTREHSESSNLYQPKCTWPWLWLPQPKTIRDSNPDFQIDPDPDVCWIAALAYFALVGVSHFAEFSEKRPVTVWEILINAIKCLILQ